MCFSRTDRLETNIINDQVKAVCNTVCRILGMRDCRTFCIQNKKMLILSGLGTFSLLQRKTDDLASLDVKKGFMHRK